MELVQNRAARDRSVGLRFRSRRSALLSSVFLGIGAVSIGSATFANDAAIGGVDCPACVLGSGQISAPGGFSDVDVNVDTAAIGTTGTPAAGVGVYAYTTEDINVTATQDITSTDRAIWLDSNSVTAGQGAINVISSGALTSTVSLGVEILQPAAEVLLDGLGTGTITGATEGVAVLGYLPGGTQEIRGFEAITGGTTSIYVLSLGADVSVQDTDQVGDTTSIGDGIFIDALGGNINIGDTVALGSVQGGDDGLELYTSGAGTMAVTVGDVTGADWGIYAIGADGDVGIAVTGAAEGTGDVGIEARTTTGRITIDADDVTGGTWGIYTRSTTGDNEITVSGDVSGGTAMAIDTIATSGNITIDGSGTATATAGDVGIWAGTTADGNVTVQDFDTVSSVDTGVYAYSAGGDISITGVGTGGGITSTTLDGIYATGQTSGGNVTISGNGAITAAEDGIEAAAVGAGTMTIEISDDVNAGAFGIYARSVDGDLTLDVASGATVSSTGVTGIDATASGAGATTIDVAADAVVEGGAFGLVTGTLATVENAGTIRTIGDTGAADNAGTGIGLWSWTGTTEFNNSGELLGQIHSDGGGVTFNNAVDGVWYAGTGVHEFHALADAVNNAGTLLIRDGVTAFDGLETFLTTDGGHLDMTYSAAATETLQVRNFSTNAGALLSFDFDAGANNNGGLGHDNSDDGLGTADTVWVTGTAAPDAGTLVSVTHVNGDPTGLAGSVALVYSGVNLDAPDPGDSIVASEFYGFATPQSFAATAFHLVDDGQGGLFYQWAPNLTTATLGAYSGGDLAGGKATAASNVASATAGFAGLGGMGSFGGGATGAIADSAASSARSGGTRDQACQNGQSSRFWTYADATSTSGSGFSGDSHGVTFGYEHDLGEVTGQSCGQLVGGVFASMGRANLASGTGASKSSNVTTGAYLRYASTEGLYASGVVAVSHAKTDLSNAVFGSTATQDSVGYAGIASLGYVMPITSAGSIDWRTSLSYGVVNGDPFTDSAGIEVDDTSSKMTTAGVSVTYRHQFDEATSGFVGVGASWAEVTRETTAFGVTVGGRSTAPTGTLAIGVSSALSERAHFDMSVQGSLSDGTSSLGGRIGIRMTF